MSGARPAGSSAASAGWPAAARRRAAGAAVPAAAALWAGLYLARVWAEAWPRGWAWRQIVLASAAGIGLAAVAVYLLRRARWRAWPLLLLAVYAGWPRADGRVALAVGVVALATLLIVQDRFDLPGWLCEAAVGGGALALYVSTLAPSVQPADAGEFQLVCAVLGIAHPPGYPLYTLLGKAFTLLPFGDPAWRVNLFAAVCAAVTLAVLARSVRLATRSAVAGLIAALALGLAPTFWAQGTFANIRSLTALLTALCIHWLLRYGEQPSGRRLAAFALTFGLAISHHGSLALLGLPFLAYLVAVDPRLFVQPRRWVAPAGSLAAGLLVLAYLPLRSAMNPSFDTPSVRTLSGLVAHVLSLGFQGDMFYFVGRPALGLRFGVLGDILSAEFGLALWVAALALGALAPGRKWRPTLLWGGVAVVNAFAAITYRAPQTVEYLLPAYVALAFGLGLGLGALLALQRRWQRALAAVLAGASVWLAVSNGLAAYPSYRALHQDMSVARQARALLEAAAPGALILSNWHEATPLWYLQQVEGLRPDVTVTYVYPEGATPNGEVWVRRIGKAVGKQQVLVTNRFAEYAATPYRYQPLEQAWEVLAPGSPPDLSGLTGEGVVLGEKLEYLGARLGPLEAEPGGQVSVSLAWQAKGALERSYSWFVQLLGPQGVAGQADVTYGAGQVEPGQPVVDRYGLSLRPDTLPGEYRLVTGAYITFPDGSWERLRTTAGQDTIPLATVRVRPRAAAPVTARPMGVAFADGSRLVGVDYDDSVAGQRRAYLHWYRPGGATDLEIALLSGREGLARSVVSGGEAGYRTVVCDLPGGAGALSLQATAGGKPVAPLGPWHYPLQGGLRLPGRGAGERYLDLGGEMVLISARWQPQAPSAGAPLAGELEFLAERPLLRDYTVSLSLDGEGWRAQNDGTPALGAIPTLKWLAGWRVRDPRGLKVPAQASGQARLRLTVYDAFTLAPLAIGDDRLANAGQGVQAVLWEGMLP